MDVPGSWCGDRIGGVLFGVLAEFYDRRGSTDFGGDGRHNQHGAFFDTNDNWTADHDYFTAVYDDHDDRRGGTS